MKNQADRKWLRVLLLVVIILGIYFRWAGLDRKVYWHDEAYTSLRLSGYTSPEVNQQAFSGREIGAEDLLIYQRVNSDKTLGDTVKSLALDDAQHPPLYYGLLRFWAQRFGSSIVALRSFSVLLSLLVFPSIYWLCWELFGSAAVGWMAMALIAISPFQVLYAQEAREYALWTVFILVSSSVFLGAMRRSKLSSPGEWSRLWGLYAVTQAISLYTFPLSVLVAVGHGLYAAIVERFRPSKALIGYSAAFLAAILSFVPWIVAARHSWSQQSGISWTNVPLPLPVLLKTWGLHFCRAFMLTNGDFGFDTASVYIGLPLLLALVGYSFYLLVRQTPKPVWLFVVTLSFTLALALALPDLILGGQRSTPSRYLMPFYLGIAIAVAHCLVVQMRALRLGARLVGYGLTAALIVVGIGACADGAKAGATWNKVISYNNQAIVQIINQAPAPLLISSSKGINFGSLLALSHMLKPTVRYQLVDGWTQPDYLTIPKISPRFQQVFFLNPSDEFRKRSEAAYRGRLELVFHDSHLWLWQLSRRSS